MSLNSKETKSPFGEGFADIIGNFGWKETSDMIYSSTAQDVERVLGKAQAGRKELDPEDLMVLVSPAAKPYIGRMAEMAAGITARRFGKTISMYIPMYVSNACTNKCVYCDKEARRF